MMPGLRGIIHKASQGSDLKDKKYSVRKPQALEAGFLWGAYHFGTGDDVDEQVDNFLEAVGDYSNTLLALDFEPNPKGSSMSLPQAVSFLEKVYKKTGQRPILYSGHFIKEAINKNSIYNVTLSRYRLWLCQYGPKAVVPSVWDNYWLWQYTGDGIGQKPHTIDGIQGDVDLNVFNGDVNQLKKEWIVSDGFTNANSVVVDTNNTDIVDKDNDGDLPWMKIAKSLLGTEEEPGSGDNPEIIKWARGLGLINDYNHDSIPWCGLFAAHVASEAGFDVPDAPLWALSWKNWGKKSDEAYGALVVFKRNGGGHVGFLVGQDDDYYHVLGGNQSDSVCITKIDKSRCVGIRWPDGVDEKLKKELPHQDLDVSISTNEK